MEITFDVTDNGKTQQIKCNDKIFYYGVHRKNISQKICLDIIEKIKKDSGKKLAIIFGDCQTRRLQTFLMNNYEFAKEYFVLSIPFVYEYANKDKIPLFKENFWSLCDLLISQRRTVNHIYGKIINTKNLPSLMPETTKIIWLPVIYFNGYFPQAIPNKRNVDTKLHVSGRFVSGDKYIEKFLTTYPGGGFV